MNKIIYAPYIGDTVFWEYARGSVRQVRAFLKSLDEITGPVIEYDGIVQFYCRSEGRFPVVPKEEEGDGK